MNYSKRTRTLADGTTSAESTYYVRLRWKGKSVVKNTGFSSLADAKRFGSALKKALAEGRMDAVTGADLRRAPSTVLISQVVEAFARAPGDWTPQTRRGYVGGLRTIIETALGTEPAWTSRPVSVLNAELVYRFKQSVSKQQADDARRAQLARSANTALRSARALFSPTLMEHYRIEAGMALPSLTEFREAPGFQGVQKSDYRIPSDELVRSTLAELEDTRESHPDRYAAIWLALGFGLRKSEAAAVRAGWFVRLNGRIHLELRCVVQPGTPGQTSTATKNGEVCPRIPVANGAWSHLGPIVESLGADDHVLAPNGTDTYRADALFDEISAWLHGLKWETTKAHHEFRALGGCWVAMRDGLLAARDWCRHSSMATTEKYYGRYIRTTVSDIHPDIHPVTVLATTLVSGEAVSDRAGLTRFDVETAGQTPVHVLDFPRVGDATPSASTKVRP